MPWPSVGGLYDKPKSLDELAEKVQQNFDALSQQFPVATNNTARVPHARAYNSGNQSLNDVTLTAITFDSEVYDNGTTTEQHSTSSSTSRFTCQVPGLYAVTGYITWDVNSTGARGAFLRFGGSTYLAGEVSAAAVSPDNDRSCVSTQYRFAVGEYVELVGYQSSGGSLNALGGDNFTNLCWHWVCP